jgi:transposase InsO family protein
MDSALSSIIERSGRNKSSMEDLLLLHHKRLGHLSFSILSRLCLRLFEKAKENKLFCDACELGKHTRSSYVSFGSRSFGVFQLTHSNVCGPCPTITFNGFRYFVSFIDCCSRVTWLYFMKSKNDVLACFRDFHKGVQTQYGAVIKILRSDNETEYTNKAFGEYLSS